MLGIFEAKTIAYHCDGHRVIIKELFGMGEKVIGNDVLGGTTCFYTHQITEIPARQAAFICEIGYCGQPIRQGFRGDVIVKLFYEFLYH